MLKTVLGSKGKMGQSYVSGTRVPVTSISIVSSVVTQVKTDEKDGYWGIQLGFGEKRVKNVAKPQLGHLKGAIKDKKAPKFLAEIRLEKEAEVKVGDQIKASDIFKVGDKIAISGTSKGKGFAGVVKRWHFAGGPKTHGQSDRQRAPGSIGQTTTPGRVFRGKHMAGRMGGNKVTVKNLHVISIEPTKDEMVISGLVPGKFGDLLTITKISEGSLKELQREVVAKVVEGEGAKIAGGAATAVPAPAGASEGQGTT